MYLTHSFFIHLGIANVNWVFNISNKYLFGYLIFQLGIFVNVNSLLANWYILCHSCYVHNMLLKSDLDLSDHIE